ncbi:hypothetical protein BDB00DRAFT_831422 [Zychaea mexicana]|uniref:uncharacterized protein n=1 Tax=Zychaea mexicana TaxID=64656 RepID=UPI0022FDD37F|nr:uncharacterized protein BDB00DRAFT_831422 [Zychaea mexicana]KAI9491777.1 hypothetical protein BDB00DRAFT_831422 [Zychaea mexicana]
MDSVEKQPRTTSSSTLFDSSTTTTTTTTSNSNSSNMYNNGGAGVHPLHEIRRPSPSLPSSDTLSQTSNNNNEEEESGLCSVFEKLKTEDQRRNSSPGAKHGDDRVKTAAHRSMSVDVGSVHHNHHPRQHPHHHQHKLPSSASSSSTTRASGNSSTNGNNVPTSTSIQDLLSKNLLFDGGDPHKTAGKWERGATDNKMAFVCVCVCIYIY